LTNFHAYVNPGNSNSTWSFSFANEYFLCQGCREFDSGPDYRMKPQIEARPTGFHGRARIRPSYAETKNKAPGGHAMTTLTPYLLFDGNCKQAMEFYKSCFGGELTEDSPAKSSMPASQHEKILNARLKSRNVDLSGSDWLRLDQSRVPGNAVCLYLNGGSFQELNTLFARLAEGGEVTDALTEMFFGTYGALNDKFGIRWMFHSNQER
jgi:PhnB protein